MTIDAGRLDGPPPELRFRRSVNLRVVLSELWDARELLRTLSERDLRARYKQTVLGLGWAVLTPVLLMVVFTVFFRRVARVETNGVPYVLFSYVGLLPWTFFASTFSSGGQTLVSNKQLLNKVYCPREVFPLASAVVAGVDTAIAVSVLGILFVVNTFMPHPTSVWVPVIFAVQIAFTLGVTFFMSVTLVYVRDLRQIMSLIIQFGLFATPVAYEFEKIPEGARPIYSLLNPLAPVIDSYRRTVLFGEQPRWGLLGLGAITAFVTLITGYLYFKRLETGIADVA